jgi:hypothetical protein
MTIVSFIIEKNYDRANELVSEKFRSLVELKILEMKKRLGAKRLVELDLSREKSSVNVQDQRRDQISNFPAKTDASSTATGKTDSPVTTIKKTVQEARINIIKVRIRNGKVQRRKKVSNVKGMRLSGTKLIRMSPAEKRRRKLGAKRGKIKRRAKLGRALMKRKRTLRKRKSMGL